MEGAASANEGAALPGGPNGSTHAEQAAANQQQDGGLAAASEDAALQGSANERTGSCSPANRDAEAPEVTNDSKKPAAANEDTAQIPATNQSSGHKSPANQNTATPSTNQNAAPHERQAPPVHDPTNDLTPLVAAANQERDAWDWSLEEAWLRAPEEEGLAAWGAELEGWEAEPDDEEEEAELEDWEVELEHCGAEPVGQGAELKPQGVGLEHSKSQGVELKGEGVGLKAQGAEPKAQRAEVEHSKGQGVGLKAQGEELEKSGEDPNAQGAELRAEGVEPKGHRAELQFCGADPNEHRVELKAEGAVPKGQGAELRTEGAEPKGQGAGLELCGADPNDHGAELKPEGAELYPDWAELIPHWAGLSPEEAALLPEEEEDFSPPRGAHWLASPDGAWSKLILRPGRGLARPGPGSLCRVRLSVPRRGRCPWGAPAASAGCGQWRSVRLGSAEGAWSALLDAALETMRGGERAWLRPRGARGAALGVRLRHFTAPPPFWAVPPSARWSSVRSGHARAAELLRAGSLPAACRAFRRSLRAAVAAAGPPPWSSEVGELKAELHAGMAQAQLRLGLAAAAAASAGKALELRPAHLGARYARGVASAAMMDLEAAREDLLAVLRARPGHAGASRELGRVRDKARQRDSQLATRLGKMFA